MMHRNLIGDLEAALERGQSRFNIQDILGHIATGRGDFALAGDMTASWIYRDGVCHVAHLAGRWTNEAATELLVRMLEDMAAHGVAEWRWEGRPGWRRFWRKKGWSP